MNQIDFIAHFHLQTKEKHIRTHKNIKDINQLFVMLT